MGCIFEVSRPTTLDGALAALDEAEARLEALLSASSEGMLISVDGRVLALNEVAAGLLGRTTEECLGRTPAELLPPEASEVVIAQIQAGSEVPYEIRLEDPAGRIVELRLRGRNILWNGLPARATTVRDITEQRRIESVLRERERRFHELADFLPVMVGEADAQGRLTYINQTSLDLLGYASDEEVLGRSAMDLLVPEDRERALVNLRRRLAGEALGPQQYLVQRKDGSSFPGLHYVAVVDGDGRPQGVRTAIVDLSERLAAEEERERLQARMLRAQKLESLGVLAGGIAHDFNNVLATVLGSAEVALMQMSPAAAAGESVRRIKRAALRASELVNQLLSYAGRGPIQIDELDLNELVVGISDLLDVSATKRVVLERDLEPHLPLVRGDPTQLRQVLMNLVTNAADALGPEGGTVHVCTRAEPSGRERRGELAFGDSLGAGPFVALEVCDRGVGMSVKVLPRIFDPFFTTKARGRGLGLAAVLGIVRSHRGAIFVRSAPGEGSHFRVVLPALATPSPEEWGESSEAAAVDLAGGPEVPVLQGTILLVDDDPMLVDATAAVLLHLGLEVLVATDGPSAIQRLQEREDIQAVLLDWTMPRMTGRRVLDSLRALRHDLPVVLMSGFDSREAVKAFEGVELAGFLPKPFRLDALLELLRQVL
jgi:PAS domain S-box-containing protein